MRDKSIKKEFLKFLQMVHQGKNAAVYFDRIAGNVSFDQGFKDFLQPTKKQLEKSLLVPKQYEILYLGNSDIDDQTLSLIQNATQLESLDLSSSKVTDQGIKHLAKLKSLRYLSLERTQVSDRALGVIGKLSFLEELDLTTTGFTDQGLSEIDGLDRLVALWIGGTQTTDQSVPVFVGVERLKTARYKKDQNFRRRQKKIERQVEIDRLTLYTFSQRTSYLSQDFINEEVSNF